MMKSSLAIAISLALLAGCQGKPGSYAFGDLKIDYPSGLQVSREEESPEQGFVSFILSDKDDPDSRMEFGISEFPEDFLATVPEEELLGELAAMADQMRNDYAALPDVTVLEQSDIQWSPSTSRPEAFAFAKVGEGNKEFYLVFSALVVGHYSISSVSRSEEPSKLEVFSNILENSAITRK